MKRLLGLLLVLGMVGCGGGDTSPKSSQAKVDKLPVQTVDMSKLVERDGLMYEINSEMPFTGVVVGKYENGQKAGEVTIKDGKQEGPTTEWYKNGQKSSESIWKDGEVASDTRWHKNGQMKSEATYKDGKKVSETKWDEEGNEIKRN